MRRILVASAKRKRRSKRDGQLKRVGFEDGQLVAPGRNIDLITLDEALNKLAEHDSRELKQALKKIPCPTLVVRGAASDVLSPEEADSIADDTLPNGSLAVVSQAGHSVMLDNPEGFLDAVAAFVFGED